MFRARAWRRPPRGQRFAVFFYEDVRIGAPGPERRDSGNPRKLLAHALDEDDGSPPRLHSALDPERRPREVDIGIRLLSVQAGNQRRVLQLQHDLRKTRDTRRRLEMTDIRLDRADRTELSFLRSLGEGLRQPRNFDGVSQLRPRAMGLDVAHGAGLDMRARQRVTYHVTLRKRARHGVAVCATPMIDARASDHGVDTISVGDRTRQRLQERGAHAFTWYESVRACTEAVTTPVAGQHPLIAQRQIGGRMEIEIHPTGNGQLTASPEQLLTGLMDGREGRRAHRVNRHARAVEIKQVGDPVGERAEARAREYFLATAPQLRPVELEFRLGDSDEHTDAATVLLRDPRARIGGVLERPVHGLEKEPLLRVYVERFPRRDVEEQRIEFGEPVDESTPFAIALSLRPGAFGVCVEESLQRPSVRGNFPDAVLA